MKAAFRQLALPLAFLAVALPVGIGAVMAMGSHKDPAADESAFAPISQGNPHFQRRAQPRWETVTTLTGSGSAARQIAIAPRAIQWKADWSCISGDIRMTIGRPAQPGKLLAASSCPDAGSETATGNGAGRLQVTASGPWQMRVSQQVDTALNEPALAGMTASSLLGRGRFHSIQKHGEGTVSLYRLPSGRLALRFEDFYTSASPGLRIWLSRAANVKSTLQARQNKYADAGALRSTLGSYNQPLPASVKAGNVHSVVIWCPTVLIAFSAAPLGQGG